MNGKAIKRILSTTSVVLLFVLLFIGGAQPQAAGLFAEPWDKLAHVGFFFVFAYLLIRCLSLPLLAVFSLIVLIGAADEIHQAFLPNRVASLDDLLADLLGLGLGLAAWAKNVI